MSTDGCNDLFGVENVQEDFSPLKCEITKPTTIIQVKGVPSCIKEKDLYPLFSQYGIVRKIISKPSTSHYYIEFENPHAVDIIQQISDENGLVIQGKQVKIMRINKIPLDLNEPSKVVLVTFLECQENITIEYITDLLKQFGSIEKVVIYKKKNTQALVEMDTIENAEKLRKTYMNVQNLKDLRMKVQYTAKKFLIVNKNSTYECDVRKRQNSGNLSSNYEEQANQKHQNTLLHTLNSNIVNTNISDTNEKKSNDSDSTTNIVSASNNQSANLLSKSNDNLQNYNQYPQSNTSTGCQTIPSSTFTQTNFNNNNSNNNSHVSNNNSNNFQENLNSLSSNNNNSSTCLNNSSIINNNNVQNQSNTNSNNCLNNTSNHNVNLNNNNDNNTFHRNENTQSEFCNNMNHQFASSLNESTYLGQSLFSVLNPGLHNTTLGMSRSNATNESNNNANCGQYSQSPKGSQLHYSLNLNQSQTDSTGQGNMMSKSQFHFIDNNYFEPERGVLVKNVASFISHDMLFNLFSLYGNIERIDKNSGLGFSAVIYQSSNQMSMALKNLNQLPLFGTPISLDILNQNNNILQFGSLTKDYSGFKDQRFKIPGSKNFKNMNPPSSTVHLSNLPENYDLNELKNLFSSVAPPLGITHFNDSTSMALACFDSIDSAIRVIITFHNYNILGRFLKIAFAKYKLNMMNPNMMPETSTKNLNHSQSSHNSNKNISVNTSPPGLGPLTSQFNIKEFLLVDENPNNNSGNSHKYNSGSNNQLHGSGHHSQTNLSSSRKTSINTDFGLNENNTQLGLLSTANQINSSYNISPIQTNLSLSCHSYSNKNTNSSNNTPKKWSKDFELENPHETQYYEEEESDSTNANSQNQSNKKIAKNQADIQVNCEIENNEGSNMRGNYIVGEFHSTTEKQQSKEDLIEKMLNYLEIQQASQTFNLFYEKIVEGAISKLLKQKKKYNKIAFKGTQENKLL